MHIAIIALFLIHGSRYGTGLPMMPNDSSPLQRLANTCENAFLADIITKKGENCKIINGSVTSQSDLVCYMFYDINTQLCAAFQHSEFTLKENYETRMKDRQNVATLCDGAKEWKFATIQTNSAYNVLLKVMSDPVNCQKLCAVSDLLSDDANYFCTYFKWGTEVIQSQEQRIAPQDSNLVLPPGAPVLNTGINSASSMNTTNVAIAAKTDVKPVDTKLAKLEETSKEENPEKSEHKNPPTSTANQTSGVEKTSEINNGVKIVEPSTAPVVVSSVNDDVDHPAVEEEPPKKDEVEKNGLEGSKDLNDAKEKLEDTNPEDDENDNDDYDQHDELPADKINKNDNVGVEPDPVVVFKGNNNPNLKIESITFPPQRVPEMYPNGIPEQFAADEDHFLPLFLTAIIIVVLLYILYHNKNKFTKVILGLLVEGRQSGRRRNSRGHAYRRLDTLEQAMSSNTAAPPSKIIY